MSLWKQVVIFFKVNLKSKGNIINNLNFQSALILKIHIRSSWNYLSATLTLSSISLM